jgi:hypothetical protein
VVAAPTPGPTQGFEGQVTAMGVGRADAPCREGLADGAGVDGAVIWPVSGRAGTALLAPPRAGEPAATIVLAARPCGFDPPAAAARPGDRLRVSNPTERLVVARLEAQDGDLRRPVQAFALPPGEPGLEWPLDVPGVFVLLAADGGAAALVVEPGGGAVTRADGRFEFGVLPAGTWEFEAFRPGFGRVRSTAVSVPGAVAPLYFVLPRS